MLLYWAANISLQVNWAESSFVIWVFLDWIGLDWIVFPPGSYTPSSPLRTSSDNGLLIKTALDLLLKVSLEHRLKLTVS